MTNPYNNDSQGGGAPQGAEGKHSQPEGNAVPPQPQPQQGWQQGQPGQPQQGWQQPQSGQPQQPQPQQGWQSGQPGQLGWQQGQPQQWQPQQGQPQQGWQQQGQQGPTAADVAQQQAQQLAANLKKGFQTANSNYSSASISVLGFLPLLIGSVLLLALAFFPWSSLTVGYSNQDAAVNINGFGYLSLSALGADFSSEEMDTFALVMGYFGVLLPLVTVALYCTAAMFFRAGTKNRVAAVLTVLAAVIGSYWVFFASRTLVGTAGDLGKDLGGLASDMDPFIASIAGELLHFKFSTSQNAVYWFAALVMILLLLHSAYLFWRVSKDQGGFNPAKAQNQMMQPAAAQAHDAQGFPQQGFPQQGYPQQGNPQQGNPQQGFPNNPQSDS